MQSYKYNGKEFVEMHGFDTYDYSARMMYPAVGGRFMTIDPMAEKYYSISPYAYCAGNPILYVDPDGKEKFKFQFHFNTSTGIIGAGIKAFGVKYRYIGAIEKELSFHVSYDTETHELSAGASNITIEHGKDAISAGGIVGGGETLQKQKGTELNASINLKSGKIKAEQTPIDEEEFKEVNEGTIGVLTGTEKEGEDHKFTIGINPELNLLIGGIGVGVNLSSQGNHGVEENKNKNQEE